MALLLTILGISLTLSILTDLRDRTIRNVVTFPAFGLALALRALDGWWGPGGFLAGVAGAFFAFLCFVWPAIRGGLGMGDLKLACVVGACLGIAHAPLALLCIGVAGGLQALAVLLLRGALVDFLAGRARGIAVPYGLSIAAGTAWAVFSERLWILA